MIANEEKSKERVLRTKSRTGHRDVQEFGATAFRAVEGVTVKSSFNTYLIKVWIFFSIQFSFPYPPLFQNYSHLALELNPSSPECARKREK